MIKLEAVRTRARFREIKKSWTRLWVASEASVFQSWDWIWAWQTHSGTKHELLIGLAWDDDDLVAALPCALLCYHGVILVEWTAQSLSDYCDGFGDPEQFADIWATILREGKPDVVRLRYVEGSANVRTMLDQTGLTKTEDCVCLLVRSQWPDGTAWFRTLNKKKRNNHARSQRKLNQLGTVEVKFATQAANDVILRLFDLKQKWVEHNHYTSALVDGGPELLQALVSCLGGLGKLQVVTSSCDGRLVAGSIHVIEGTRLLSFFAAYDPDFESASPGIMLMTEYTRWAFDHGFSEVDYLRGAESYKFEFSNTQIALASFVESRSIKGALALSAFRLIQAAKEFRTKPLEQTSIGAAYKTQAETSRLRTYPNDTVATNT